MSLKLVKQKIREDGEAIIVQKLQYGMQVGPNWFPHVTAVTETHVTGHFVDPELENITGTRRKFHVQHNDKGFSLGGGSTSGSVKFYFKRVLTNTEK